MVLPPRRETNVWVEYAHIERCFGVVSLGNTTLRRGKISYGWSACCIGAVPSGTGAFCHGIASCDPVVSCNAVLRRSGTLFCLVKGMVGYGTVLYRNGLVR